MKRIYILTLLYLVVLFSCENATEQSANQTIDVQFGYEMNSRSKAVNKTPAAVVMTIKQGATTIHQDLKLPVTNFNGNIVTQPFALKVGNYSITDYKIVNAGDTVIYATPVEGSTAARLVTDALEINFTVSANGNTVIKPEVLDVEAFTPEEFGYPSGGFAIVPTFHFLISVNLFNTTIGAYQLTDAQVEVKSGNSIDFNEAIAATTKAIEVRDEDSTYTVKVTKAGFKTWSKTYSNAEMKTFDGKDAGETPLTVVLEKETNLTINATSINSRVAVVNSVNYQNLNISTSDIANNDKATFSSITGTANDIKLVSGTQEGPYVDHGAGVTDGQETIITLNTSTNLNGYDISSVYLAFGSKNAGDLRSYDLYFSRVGTTHFQLVRSVSSVGSPTGSWSSANWGDDTITPTSGGTIATNVGAIKVVWKQAGSFTAYKVWEVDVYGTPSN